MTWTFADWTKRKPVSVSVNEARYAIVGTYRGSAGVLCWTTNRTDAEAGKVWYNRRGGETYVVTAPEAVR